MGSSSKAGRVGSMATRRIEIQKLVTGLRKSVHVQCKMCGRTPGQGLMLGGLGITFSEMVVKPGITIDRVFKELDERGLMCRRCWSYSTRVKTVGLSCQTKGQNRTSEELMRDPKVREQMKEKGIAVPDPMVKRGVPQIEGL